MNLGKYPTKSFIVGELTRSGLRCVETGDSVHIVCPFHRDGDPSLSVCLGSGKIPPGVFHCFSCAEKGTWNKLAERLGLRAWGNGDKQNDEIAIYKTHVEVKESIKNDNFVLRKWDSSWRRYSNEFLKQFHVKTLIDKNSKIPYMYIPIEYGGDLYGYIRARLKKTDPGPKYFFSPKMTKILYPVDFMLRQHTPVITLVEGVTDAYRLIKNRIPAVALLGVSLTPMMKEQLELLDVKHVLLCLDGDAAGKRAVNGYTLSNGDKKIGLKKQLKELGYGVTNVLLPKGTDPDSMPKHCLQKLRDITLKKNGTLLPKNKR